MTFCVKRKVTNSSQFRSNTDGDKIADEIEEKMSSFYKTKNDRFLYHPYKQSPSITNGVDSRGSIDTLFTKPILDNQEIVYDPCQKKWTLDNNKKSG